MTAPASTPAERPLRADARRNREKILDAARRAFSATGLEAQMEDIARRAGVGVGTVYRHFPTKDALVAALAEAHFAWLAGVVEDAYDDEGSAWERLTTTLRETAAIMAADVALCELIARRPLVIHAAAEAESRLEAAVDRLVRAACAEGTIRPDARVEDIHTVMCGFGHVAAQQQAGADLDWERYLEIVFDGLRARD